MEHGYPRPQLRREWWESLNGVWEFAIDRQARWRHAGDVDWVATINVPFAPETPASGVGDAGLYKSVWYRRTFRAPELAPGERLILHFGAVDYEATVWVNSHRAFKHVGGYTPFRGDITALLVDGVQTVVVLAHDDPHDLAKPRGKQDWLPEPHAIWYPRTTGIWQTVWMERVPSTSVARLRWTSNVERWEVGLEVELEGEQRDDLTLRVRIFTPDALVADDTYRVVGSEVSRRIALPDPGIDDFRNELLWSPSRPTLLDVQIELRDDDGHVLDVVESYCALRSIGVQTDRFMLNGRPYRLRLVLDQGYWPEGGQTAPDDEAYRRDVELAKAMGFNGVRKHQKIESPRYLYWADRLGLLVCEEMPSAYRFTRRSIERLTREWLEVIERDSSHPCIVAWVPFNESWGVPDLPAIAAQQHYVHALYALTKTLDPERPVISNDGWESVKTDLIGIHDYDNEPQRLANRYSTHEVIPQLLERARPEGRLLVLQGQAHSGQPIMLSEFGGIAYSLDAEGTWGYSRVDSSEELSERYQQLLSAVHGMEVLCGFCYTQFADTYQERNGLLFADRSPKFPLQEISVFTRGPRRPREDLLLRSSPNRDGIPE